jgi:ATP-dependent Clp protease protease subunit
MSCGAWLLAAGTKGLRFASPSSDIMLHEVSAGHVGKNSDIKNDSEHTKYINDSLFKTLAEWAGKKERYFLDLLKEKSNVDLYLTAEQAKRHGLIDHVGIPDLVKQ